MKYKLKFILSIIFISLMLSALTLTDLYVHNFHSVIAHTIYRSRQLSAAQFVQVMQTYHIKSIVNLRGVNADKSWYKAEVQVAAANNVSHYDLALHSKTLPTSQQLQRLVQILQIAPKPLLIHCESGVDRSGLAAMISLILNNAPLATAAKQVSINYFVLSDQSVGKQFLRLYEQWLQKNNMRSNSAHLLTFVYKYKI